MFEFLKYLGELIAMSLSFYFAVLLGAKRALEWEYEEREKNEPEKIAKAEAIIDHAASKNQSSHWADFYESLEQKRWEKRNKERQIFWD